MPKPFDATVKDIAQLGPKSFVEVLDAPTTLPVRLLKVDLSTVTTAADLVFGLGEPVKEILHVDVQAGPSADLHVNVLAYSALLYRTYRVPAHSIVLLLRPRAKHANLTGTVRYAARPRRGK